MRMVMPKTSQDQQLVVVKTLLDSNDDDDADMTSASSVVDDDDSDQSLQITELMRENERKMRTLTDSCMNRFLSMTQTFKALPSSSSTVAIPSTMKGMLQKQSSSMELDTMSSAPSFMFFVETLKQLIMKEERKREKTYLPPEDDISSSDLYTRLSIGITQCLRDYEGEITHAKRRISDLNEQQEHILNENKHVVSQLTEAFEQNTISLRQNYEKRLTKQREESVKISQCLDNYKTEILTLRESYEKKLRVKDELINEINERLVKSETENATRQHALHLKIEHFQQSFDTLQARNKQVEQNNQIKTKENHDLLAQISNLQHQIQRLQHGIASKANECTELSQKLAATLPRIAECERFGSELQQWFLMISPEHSSAELTLDEMSNIVTSKLSQMENLRKQFQIIDEELDSAHILVGDHLSDRIHHMITLNKQYETAHGEISNKYQALLLQTNMLTGIIKQHSTEVANHKSNEEQLKEFNEQLLNENQQLKIEIQECRSKLMQATNSSNQLEHECGLNKQYSRDVQIQYESLKAENQVLTNELHTKREAIKHYEQEIHSMQQLFDIAMKEKQIQSDQLKHERQLFQTENDTLKQIVIRDGRDKPPNKALQMNLVTLQNLYDKSFRYKETVDGESQREQRSSSHEVTRYIAIDPSQETEIVDCVVHRRATSTPTPGDKDGQQLKAIQSLGVTKQINAILSDMKILLTHGREVVIKHEEEMVPERDLKGRERSKSRRSKRERTPVIDNKQQ